MSRATLMRRSSNMGASLGKASRESKKVVRSITVAMWYYFSLWKTMRVEEPFVALSTSFCISCLPFFSLDHRLTFSLSMIRTWSRPNSLRHRSGLFFFFSSWCHNQREKQRLSMAVTGSFRSFLCLDLFSLVVLSSNLLGSNRMGQERPTKEDGQKKTVVFFSFFRVV